MTKEKKRKVTPQKTVEILKKHGTTVTLDEAKIILAMMYEFGKLAVNQDLIKGRH
ncbi:hypothetical protein [Olivibacter sp. XZL3]|uniref:hypothetical protein n=1 Tax=Olivibacter sp. XZL3 TaxID=1735116 RepID=UPI001416F063|nr:hypothetical protein [Olivibacter sp. XZL3]